MLSNPFTEVGSVSCGDCTIIPLFCHTGSSACEISIFSDKIIMTREDSPGHSLLAEIVWLVDLKNGQQKNKMGSGQSSLSRLKLMK